MSLSLILKVCILIIMYNVTPARWVKYETRFTYTDATKNLCSDCVKSINSICTMGLKWMHSHHLFHWCHLNEQWMDNVSSFNDSPLQQWLSTFLARCLGHMHRVSVWLNVDLKRCTGEVVFSSCLVIVAVVIDQGKKVRTRQSREEALAQQARSLFCLMTIDVWERIGNGRQEKGLAN